VFLCRHGRPAGELPTQFFLNLLAGGIRWGIGDETAKLSRNLTEVAPGYAQISAKGRTQIEHDFTIHCTNEKLHLAYRQTAELFALAAIAIVLPDFELQ